MAGFLTLGRTFFSHPLWAEERPYSRAEAWLDFLQTAAFSETKRLIAGMMIEIPRGGLVASVRYLSDRWKWSNTKVCQYLDMLEAERMIRREKRQGYTLILLCNYEEYNSEKRRGNDAETTARRRGNDKEEQGEQRKQGEGGKRRASALTEVLEFCRAEGIHASDGEWFWEKCQGNGWKNSGQPIKDWHATLRSWKKAGYLPTQKQGMKQPDAGAAPKTADRLTVLRRHVEKYGASAFREWLRGQYPTHPEGADDYRRATVDILAEFLRNKGERA